MKLRTLYILLVVSVLVSACGSDTGRQKNGGGDSTSTARRDSTTDAPTAAEGSPVILFLGNSLSDGLGVDDDDAFPSLIQERIDSLGWEFQVINAGVSGETTADGLSRIDWLLKKPVDVLVLELGGNDGLRGIPTEVTRTNLEQIIGRTRQSYPDVEIVLAGMQIPPNLGHDYTRDFREVYPYIAEKYDVHLIPFLLQDVGGVDSLMQADGIHPNVKGHQKVAENVWSVLRPVLEVRRKPES